jgi:hypothetical protein
VPNPPATEPMRRWEWQQMIFRLEADIEFKAIAWAYGGFARADGSNVKPGRDLVAYGVQLSERQLGEYLKRLIAMGLLTQTARGGGRGGMGVPTTYRLSMPRDGALVFCLGPEFEHLIERKTAPAPLKAIEASKKARAERKGAAAQTAEAAPTDRKAASGQSAPAPQIEGNAPSGHSAEAEPIDQNRPSGDSGEGAEIEENTGSAQSPVDTSADRNPTSVRSSSQAIGTQKAASGHSENEEKPLLDRPEAAIRLTGSPGFPLLLDRSDKEEHGRSLGGDLTRAHPGAESAPAPGDGAADERSLADARTILESLPESDIRALIAMAQRDLSEQGDAHADSRRLLIRAADLAAQASLAIARAELNAEGQPDAGPARLIERAAAVAGRAALPAPSPPDRAALTAGARLRIRAAKNGAPYADRSWTDDPTPATTKAAS